MIPLYTYFLITPKYTQDSWSLISEAGFLELSRGSGQGGVRQWYRAELRCGLLEAPWESGGYECVHCDVQNEER